MRRDTRFPRPDRFTLEQGLPPGTLSHPQAYGVWSVLLQCDDPHDVAHKFRSYRDSNFCSIPREQLRAMRDTLILGMRESNKTSAKPLKEKQKGRHYADYEKEWAEKPRTGA
jgi:hypothetical protein